jgi:hypothetical protein
MARSSIAADRAVESSAAPGRLAPRLVLASEALREDLAPLEPGSRAAPGVISGVALALALLAIGLRPGGADGATASSITFAAAGATAALASLPLSYPVRGVAVSVVGAGLLLLGAGAGGPLAGLRVGSTLGVEVWRILAVALLPGALLFRARYRAYPRARIVLGAALVAAAPFALCRGLVLLDSAAALADRARAAVDVAIILSGLFGFMGADTTAGGAVWAALVLGVLSSDIALRGLDTAVGLSHWREHAAAAIGTAAAATLTATGGYHLLASWLAGDAQRAARAVGDGGPRGSAGRAGGPREAAGSGRA